eukprot:m.356050 g.356050  ORF g.356050 m.356050 type:complete len:73 (-) comp20744_c0_seq2:1811-2029(-)
MIQKQDAKNAQCERWDSMSATQRVKPRGMQYSTIPLLKVLAVHQSSMWISCNIAAAHARVGGVQMGRTTSPL